MQRLVAWSLNGKVIAFGGVGWDEAHTQRRGILLLMDGATGARRCALVGHRKAVRSVVFSPNGKLLASASADETVRLWEVSSGKELQTLKGHRSSVLGVAFSPDEKHLVSTDENATILVWDVSRGELVSSVQTEAESIMCLACHPTKELFAVTELRREGEESFDGVVLWELRGKTQLVKLPTLYKSKHEIRALLFHKDGEHLAVADDDGMVHVWNLQKKKSIYSLNHADAVQGITFSADGKALGVTTARWLTIWKFEGKKGD